MESRQLDTASVAQQPADHRKAAAGREEASDHRAEDHEPAHLRLFPVSPVPVVEPRPVLLGYGLQRAPTPHIPLSATPVLPFGVC